MGKGYDLRLLVYTPRTRVVGKGRPHGTTTVECTGGRVGGVPVTPTSCRRPLSSHPRHRTTWGSDDRVHLRLGTESTTGLLSPGTRLRTHPRPHGRGPQRPVSYRGWGWGGRPSPVVLCNRQGELGPIIIEETRSSPIFIRVGECVRVSPWATDPHVSSV